MQDTSTVPRNPDSGKPARRPVVDEQLADELLGKAQKQGVELRLRWAALPAPGLAPTRGAIRNIWQAQDRHARRPHPRGQRNSLDTRNGITKNQVTYPVTP
jgi:hypothetical protein